MADGTKKPKGWLIAALLTFLLGLAGCGAGGALAVPFFGDLVDYVSELENLATTVPMGESTSYSSSSDKGVVLLSEEAACTGESADGSSVSFEGYQAFGPGSTVEIQNIQMSGYILFDTRSASDYSITCGSPTSAGTYVVAAAPTFLIDGAGKLGAGVLAGLAGGFLVFLSLIFLIVGLVKRSSWKKRQGGGLPPFQGAAAGGGYAPPPPGGGYAPPPGGGYAPPPPAAPQPAAPQPAAPQPAAPQPAAPQPAAPQPTAPPPAPAPPASPPPAQPGWGEPPASPPPFGGDAPPPPPQG